MLLTGRFLPVFTRGCLRWHLYQKPHYSMPEPPPRAGIRERNPRIVCDDQGLFPSWPVIAGRSRGGTARHLQEGVISKHFSILCEKPDKGGNRCDASRSYSSARPLRS